MVIDPKGGVFEPNTADRCHIQESTEPSAPTRGKVWPRLCTCRSDELRYPVLHTPPPDRPVENASHHPVLPVKLPSSCARIRVHSAPLWPRCPSREDDRFRLRVASGLFVYAQAGHRILSNCGYELKSPSRSLWSAVLDRSIAEPSFFHSCGEQAAEKGSRRFQLLLPPLLERSDSS